MRSIFIAVFLVSASALAAQASCGAATCPLDTRSSFQRDRGLLRMGYEFEFIDQDQPRIGTNDARVGEISGHHDEQRTINRIHRFSVTWAPTHRLSLDIGLPLVSRSHRHIHNHQGGTQILPQGWDFSDIGDLWVQTRYVVFKPEEAKHPTLSAIAGVEFPTGKNHVINDSGAHAEPGITPGSASYDFLVGGVSLQHFSVPMLLGDYALMPFFVSVTYKMNGKGHDDYRLGNVLNANVGVTYPVLARLGAIGQLNYVVKEKDEQGLTHEEVEKTGGEYLYASPGLAVRLTDSLDWSTVVQIPIHQRVNNIQIASDFNLQSGIYYRFQL